MEGRSSLSRRHLLVGAAAAGTAGALAQVPSLARATSPGDASKTPKRPAATFPGQAETMHGWVGKDRSTLIKFTIAEGAEYHCEPMAPQLRNERVFDWLETRARPAAWMI